MRYFKNIITICFFSLFLSGCYEWVVRFWNGETQKLSPAEEKASDECFQELRSLPRPKNEYVGSKEMQDWLGKIYGPAERECMRRKGF